MDAYDFDTPPGTSFTVDAGWGALNDSPSGSPLVRIRNADVPQFFTMTVTFEAGPMWVAVFFEVADDKTISATAAWAGGRDISDALRELTELRPMAWWERKCLVTLAFGLGEDELIATRGTGLGDSTDIEGLRVIWAKLSAAAEVPTGRRNNRITEEMLERVAETYRSTVASGSPTVAVAQEFGVSRAQAARYVAKARGAGYLRPAIGPVGGEA